MRNRVNVLLACAALLALDGLCALAAHADPDGEEREILYGGENRWVPSLSIMGGAVFQDQDGRADSVLFEGSNPDPVPLQGRGGRDDLVVGAFVGTSLEIMSPALPIPTRPRFFFGGEILPTFSSDRNLVAEGDPDCVRGPEADAPCAVEEDGSRVNPFGEDLANGQGTELTTEVQTLTFGATTGVSFPFSFGERQLRFKPSFSWLSYKVDASGFVVNAECLPNSITNPDQTQCTDTTIFGFTNPGFLRQPESLSASDSKRFHSIGPGFDLEVDTGRFGPIGSALFLGGRAYHVLGDRSFSFGTSETYNDILCAPDCPDTAVAKFETKVDPWLFRAHVGIRFQWLGGFSFGSWGD